MECIDDPNVLFVNNMTIDGNTSICIYPPPFECLGVGDNITDIHLNPVFTGEKHFLSSN